MPWIWSLPFKESLNGLDNDVERKDGSNLFRSEQKTD